MTDALIKTAKTAALRHLTRRRRTRHELFLYLRRKGFSPEVCDLAIVKMDDYGYIDDAEFSRFWVRNKLGKKGFRWLRLDLRAKGVNSTIIDQVLDEYGLDSEYNCAARIVEKELSKSTGGAERQKILSALNRRGYSWDVISKIRITSLGT
jgi:regulatory protein